MGFVYVVEVEEVEGQERFGDRKWMGSMFSLLSSTEERSDSKVVALRFWRVEGVIRAGDIVSFCV